LNLHFHSESVIILECLWPAKYLSGPGPKAALLPHSRPDLEDSDRGINFGPDQDNRDALLFLELVVYWQPGCLICQIDATERIQCKNGLALKQAGKLQHTASVNECLHRDSPNFLF
jgi:hypothetical protein